MSTDAQKIKSPPNVEICLCEEIGQEIHIIGKFVAVIWKLEPIKKTFREETGSLVDFVRWERRGHPWIDFPRLVFHPNGEVFRQPDDSSVANGLSLDDAYKLQGEIAMAIAYLEKIRANSMESPPQIITA